MGGLAILVLAALLWTYWAYDAIPMLRNPQRYKAEEWFFGRCWFAVATLATAAGSWLLFASRAKIR